MKGTEEMCDVWRMMDENENVNGNGNCHLTPLIKQILDSVFYLWTQLDTLAYELQA